MKRYSSAPCLAEEGGEAKRIKSVEVFREPNAREYLQLALARVLELQREIKEGTYVTQTDSTSDLGESGSDEDLTKEVLSKVFENLPGTPSTVGAIIDKAARPGNPRIDSIRGKRIQLLGYDTCRRTAVEFMRNVVRESSSRGINGNQPGFRFGTYSRDEPKIALRRTGLLREDRRNGGFNASYDHGIRSRMLKSLDLHLAVKQRDYTMKLMRSEM
ncbi:hypothetical protein KM043_000382 [Ampulex compressa]|nr:hypothetical protein KM043_000382 [Ampulex compressa]